MHFIYHIVNNNVDKRSEVVVCKLRKGHNSGIYYLPGKRGWRKAEGTADITSHKTILH